VRSTRRPFLLAPITSSLFRTTSVGPFDNERSLSSCLAPPNQVLRTEHLSTIRTDACDKEGCDDVRIYANISSRSRP